jgi:hypothetical protein
MPSTSKKHDILARLARSEVVSVRHFRNQHSNHDIRNQAFNRYLQRYWPFRLKDDTPPHPDEESPAAQAFRAMRALLDQARLTINFDCCAWFRQLIPPATHSQGSGVPCDELEALEMQFGSFARKHHLPGIRHAWQVQDRIAQYGTRDSADFRPALRPHYAVLDFAHYPGGGFCHAGESFIVLKNHLKLNATYLPTISPLVNADLHARRTEYGGRPLTLDDVTATHLDLDRILLFCPPILLDALHRLTQTPDNVSHWDSGAIGHHCIEAHLYTDIQFKRDVAGICISLDEVRKGPERALLYNRQPCRKNISWNNCDFRVTLMNLQNFARHHNIPLTFI